MTPKNNSSEFGVMFRQILNKPDREANVKVKKLIRKPCMKHPRILRLNVVEALNRLERMAQFFDVQDDALVLLKIYRDHIGCFSQAVSAPLPINPELVPFVKCLDEAFKAIHNYKPEDYFSEGTYLLSQARTAEIRRLPADEIKEKLIELGILDPKRHGKTKGKIKQEVINYFEPRFSVSSRSLDTYIRELSKKK